MFESLKAWFASIKTDDKLFNHQDEAIIHVALASLLYHIIKSNQQETEREKHIFAQIMQDEFDLSTEQTAELYRYVKTLESDLRTDLNTVNLYLKQNPNLRLRFMEKLNHLMELEGINSKELEIFSDAIQVFFPEIRQEYEEF